MQIERKCFFNPLNHKVKSILSFKESYSKGKKGQHFHKCLRSGQAQGGWPPRPYGQSDQKIRIFYAFANARVKRKTTIESNEMEMKSICIFGRFFLEIESHNCLLNSKVDDAPNQNVNFEIRQYFLPKSDFEDKFMDQFEKFSPDKSKKSN